MLLLDQENGLLVRDPLVHSLPGPRRIDQRMQAAVTPATEWPQVFVVFVPQPVIRRMVQVVSGHSPLLATRPHTHHPGRRDAPEFVLGPPRPSTEPLRRLDVAGIERTPFVPALGFPGPRAELTHGRCARRTATLDTQSCPGMPRQSLRHRPCTQRTGGYH